MHNGSDGRVRIVSWNDSLAVMVEIDGSESVLDWDASADNMPE